MENKSMTQPEGQPTTMTVREQIENIVRESFWGDHKNADKIAPLVDRLESLISNAKEEGAVTALKGIVWMYSDDADREDLATLLDDVEASIAFKIEHPELALHSPLSSNQPKESPCHLCKSGVEHYNHEFI